MSVISHYKRICNVEIGGCDKKIDIDDTVSVKRGELHLCKPCAGKILYKYIQKEALDEPKQ